MNDRDDDKPNYNVGYGRPPKHRRFRKGQSGNPRGRPKGGKNLRTALTEQLSAPVVVVEKGRQKKISKGEALVARLVNDAAQGKDRAREQIFKLQIPVEDAAPSQRPPAAEREHLDRVMARFKERLRASVRDEINQEAARDRQSPHDQRKEGDDDR